MNRRSHAVDSRRDEDAIAAAASNTKKQQTTRTSSGNLRKHHHHFPAARATIVVHLLTISPLATVLGLLLVAFYVFPQLAQTPHQSLSADNANVMMHHPNNANIQSVTKSNAVRSKPPQPQTPLLTDTSAADALRVKLVDVYNVFKPITTPFVKQNRPLDPDKPVEYHIVFSTGCSLYQDWQSYVFFYHAAQIQQPGTVTRIISGCKEEERATAESIFASQIAPLNPNFRIHFTPDFQYILDDKKKFPYFNKPFGTRHWLEHGLGHPDKPINEDAIVVLLDPDQLLLRPFRDNNFTNTFWKFLDNDETPRRQIAHGAPMGQLYGFGLQWYSKINMAQIVSDSPILRLSSHDARKGYIVGPPYVATARDLHAITVTWSELVPHVHQQYPYLLAEMFAYSLAAAHLELSHQTAASFMVSDVSGGNGEGWKFVDMLDNEKVCSVHDQDPEQLPNVLHFCQRYGWGPYFFGKRRLPKDFLTCGSPLLAEPPADVWNLYDSASFPGDGGRERYRDDEKNAKRNVWSVCQLIHSVNEAATYFKQQHCSSEEANFNKTLGFVAPFLQGEQKRP